MSRFVDELKRFSQAENQPMGFRTSPSLLHRPKMMLLVVLDEAGGPAADQVAGADAGLVALAASSPAAVKAASDEVPGIPWGAWLPGGGKAAGATLKTGCDFIVFPPDTLLAMPKEDVGKVLAIGASLGEGLLRAINELPVDAVLVTAEPKTGSHLTWQHLMFFRRSADLLAKPLLAQVPPTISAEELQAVWEAGVVGIVVAPGKKAGGKIAGLRQIIDQLKLPAPGRKRKMTPLVPYIAREPEGAEGADEDEGEE